MKEVILIGASSGIGRTLAKVLAREGYLVGISSRRMPLLLEVQQELGVRLGEAFARVGQTDPRKKREVPSAHRSRPPK